MSQPLSHSSYAIAAEAASFALVELAILLEIAPEEQASMAMQESLDEKHYRLAEESGYRLAT